MFTYTVTSSGPTLLVERKMHGTRSAVRSVPVPLLTHSYGLHVVRARFTRNSNSTTEHHPPNQQKRACTLARAPERVCHSAFATLCPQNPSRLLRQNPVRRVQLIVSRDSDRSHAPDKLASRVSGAECAVVSSSSSSSWWVVVSRSRVVSCLLSLTRRVSSPSGFGGGGGGPYDFRVRHRRRPVVPGPARCLIKQRPCRTFYFV